MIGLRLLNYVGQSNSSSFGEPRELMRSNSRDLSRELSRELTTRDVSRDIMHYPGDSCLMLSTTEKYRIYSIGLNLSLGSTAERIPVSSVINNVRGVDRSSNIYDFPTTKVNEDVFFDLVEMEKVAFGQPFTVTVQLQVTSI